MVTRTLLIHGYGLRVRTGGRTGRRMTPDGAAEAPADEVQVTIEEWDAEDTRGVVRDSQEDEGLHADGRVGPVTWAARWQAPVTR